jgi:hypothetical protein
MEIFSCQDFPKIMVNIKLDHRVINFMLFELTEINKVPDYQQESKFTIMPNPATDKLIIETSTIPV